MPAQPNRALAQALWDALRPDPFYATLAQQCRPPTDATMVAYFTLSLEIADQYGRLDLPSQEMTGAALWTLPLPKAAETAASRHKSERLAQVLGPQGTQFYTTVGAAMHQETGPAVAPADWYLSILGVAPERQGAGLGRKLLHPALTLADAQQQHCYLETFSETNHAFYERLGFSTVRRCEVPQIAAPYWVMRRAPASRPARSHMS